MDDKLFVCQFCGRLTDVDPSDQEIPADYCHHEDLNAPVAQLDGAKVS
jgi:hypothetical protein